MCLGDFLFVLLRDKEDVDNLQNSEGVQDKKGDEPPLLGQVRGFPQRDPFPWQHPHRCEQKQNPVVLNKCQIHGLIVSKKHAVGTQNAV